jgi:hypothetical protein
MNRPGTVGSNRPKSIVTIIEFVVLAVACIAAIIGLYLTGYLTLNKRSVINYKITSTSGRALISYTQANGEMSKLTEVTTPWSKTIIFNDWLDIYIIAGNPLTNGEITCSLRVNTRLLDEQKAVYPDDKVACRAILP